MTIYTPVQFNYQDGLDEVGLRHSMPRLLNEDLPTYRRRVLAEVRDPSGGTQEDYFRTGSRVLGQFAVNTFTIDLVKIGDTPVAPDPRIEITSSMIRTWSDYTNGVIDIEEQLTDIKFLRDFEVLFLGNLYFTCSALEPEHDFKFCNQLRISNSDGLVVRDILRPSTENKLRVELVKNLVFEDNAVFSRLRGSKVLIEQAGDYYVDTVHGVVFSYSVQGGYATYEYYGFPFSIYWEPVRFWALNDVDKDRILYNSSLSDETGEPVFDQLNSNGANIGNEVYLAHPLSWGE